MRKKCPVLTLVLCFAIVQTVGCKWLSRPNISGVWRGSIEGTDKRGRKWQGPAELTLNQNGDAITGTLVFTPPQAGRDRKSTRLNSSHVEISYAVFCLKKKNTKLY